MKVTLVLSLALVSAFLNAYEMRITHTPWWSQKAHFNGIESSYQFFSPPTRRPNRAKLQNYPSQNSWNYPSQNSWNYPSQNSISQKPYWKTNSNKDRLFWKNYKIEMARLKTQQMGEWPDYIPPIRMIKLPLDEPPAPL